MNEKKLVFVYNADSGAISLVKDFWKKILRPSSYECNLCMQTFGAFSMKKDWKKILAQVLQGEIPIHNALKYHQVSAACLIGSRTPRTDGK